MKTIPLRFINTNPKALNEFENFSVRSVGEFMAGNDLFQDIDHYFYTSFAERKGCSYN